MSRNAAGAHALTLQQCWQPQPRQAQPPLQHATLPGLLLHCISDMTAQKLGLSWEQAVQERLKALRAKICLELINHSLN